MTRLPPWPEVWQAIVALRPPVLDGLDLTPNEDGWVSIFCPQHDDENASLRVNIETGGIKCMAGCDVGSNLNDLEELVLGMARPRKGRRPKKVLDDLAERRLLPRDWLVNTFGLDKAPGGYSIPVDDPEVDPDIEIDYDIEGLHKRRRHWLYKRGAWIDPKATTRPKYRWDPKLSESGVKARDLIYNLHRIKDRLPPEKLVYVCAGAPDVWVMHHAGFPAISFLAGENNTPSPRAVSKLLDAGVKEAIIIYDNDEAGREGAEKDAIELSRAGISTTALLLPEEVGEKGDLTDLWVRCGGDEDEFVAVLEAAEVRTWPAEDVPGREVARAEARRRERQHDALPEECWVEPFASYREAVRPSTSACSEYHFFALMNVLGALFGRRAYIQYGRRLYPNQYTVLIGATHTFKSTANARATEMIETLYEKDEEAQVVRPLPGTRLAVEEATGSAEGLLEAAAFADAEPDEVEAIRGMMGWKRVKKDEDSSNSEYFDEADLELKKERRLLVRQDEFTKMLSKAKQGGGGSGFIPHLLTAFDCPKEIRLRTRQRPVILVNVVVSILSDSTVEHLGRYFDELEWTSGFGNRILFVDGRPGETLPKPSAPEPEAWARAAEYIREAYVELAGEHGGTYGTEYVLSPKAEEVWDQLYREWVDGRSQGYSAGQLAATERVADYALKFALIYAVMAADGQRVVSHEDIELGWKVARYAERVSLGLVGSLIEDKQARWQESIREYITERGTVSGSDLHQNFKQIPAPTLNMLLENLEKLGVVKRTARGYCLFR